MPEEHGFEFLEHTADLRFKAYASDLAGAFEQAAYALFSSIIELDCVREKQTYEISLGSDSKQELLHDWLSELLFLFESEGVAFHRFKIRLGGGVLKAEAFGEPIDLSRHKIKVEVKAITYHGMSIRQKDGLHIVEVLADI